MNFIHKHLLYIQLKPGLFVYHFLKELPPPPLF